MEKEQILEAISQLPEISANKFPIEDNETWEGNDSGAHFKFTRNFIKHQDRKISFLVLSVSGEKAGKEKIINDFRETLGKPASQKEYPDLLGIEFVSWEAIHNT